MLTALARWLARIPRERRRKSADIFAVSMYRRQEKKRRTVRRKITPARIERVISFLSKIN